MTLKQRHLRTGPLRLGRNVEHLRTLSNRGLCYIAINTLCRPNCIATTQQLLSFCYFLYPPPIVRYHFEHRLWR